jgi:TolB-like protein/Tfp pilus assembly protein PilF
MNQDSINQTTVDGGVFVSYASQDAAVANSIVENLEGQGLKCWIAPRDVRPGAQYADAIVRAINDAKAVVLVLSANAAASSHVAREVERAASKRKPIIPFRLDSAALNPELEYFLSNSQWIDVPALGMKAALAKIQEAVGQGLAIASQPVATSRNAGSTKRIAIAAAVIVALGVVVGSGYYFWKSSHGGVQAPSVAAIMDKSIAVLPFVDMSEKKDQEYFADGMAEEIIDLLVKVPGLKVISRTSSFQFKGKTEDLRIIGKQLGVAYVLEGSVRKSGDRLRITAQLIDSRDGTHLMSQSYDQDFSDVLKMQDEIAASLVRVLQVEVSEHVLVVRSALFNTQAYTLYLQGLHAKDRFDQQGFEQAVNDFQEALDLDPSFAASAGGLANAYFLLGQFGFMAPSVAFKKAREAAQQALKLDSKLAATHALLGNISIAYDWDWAAASQEIQSALADAPNDAYVLFIAAVQAQVMGQQDKALNFIGASLAQDPLNPSSYLILSYVQIRRQRLVEAQAALRRTLEISPTFIFANYYLGLVLLARGDPHGALEEVRKENDAGLRLAGTAIVDFAMGAKADSDASLRQVLKTHAQRAYEIAGIYAFRGETDEAFRWLDRAYDQKDPYLYSIKGNPLLKKVEGDPRYKAFLRKMNLPEG